MDKNNIKQFSTYFLFDVINKTIPFVLLPIITSYLTTVEFGLVSNFLAVLQIFTIIISYSSYTKFSTSFYNNQDDIAKLFSNLLYLILLIFITCVILVFLLNPLIFKYFKIDLIFQIVALVTALASAVISLYTTYLIMRKKPIVYGFVQNLQSGGLFVFSILFVVVFLMGWKGRIFAQVISYILILFLVLFLSFREKILCLFFDKKIIKEVLIWGLPLLPHTLSYWIKGGLDKMIVTTYEGLSINGIYSLALSLGSVMSLITTSFYNVYSPYMYKLLYNYDNSTIEIKDRILKNLLKKNGYFILCYLVLVILAYVILYFVIHLFFSGDYLIAVDYLPYVLLTNLIYAIYTINSGFLFYRNKTKIIGSITITCSILQAVLNIILIKRIGIFGVLYAGIISAVFIASFITYFSFKEYHIIK